MHTKFVKAQSLTHQHVLVGESRGLSHCYSDAKASSAMIGLVVVETEHGALYLDPEELMEVVG